MPLNPQTIGLAMSHGFAGSYARQPDMIVTTAPLGGTAAVPFGMPLVRGQEGAVIPRGAGDTGNRFVGVAGREVKSAADYYGQSEGRYEPGEPVSVFQRGCVNVRCQKGAPVVDGTVYVRVNASGGYPAGGFEAEADGENTVALVNAQWGGPADSHGVAELRIAYVGPSVEAQGGGGDYVPLAGGTMTGPLILSGDPEEELGAATREFVENTITTALTGNYLLLAGGTMKGDLDMGGHALKNVVLPAATTNALGGVKQMAAIADLTAVPTQEDFNNLLAALRTAGLLAT